MVQIHSPRPFIPLLSCSCSHFQIARRFAFPSMPSNNDDLGRKFETQTRLLCHFFAKRHVRFDLVVEAGHALSGMTHTELQETWRGPRLFLIIQRAQDMLSIELLRTSLRSVL